MKKMPRQKEPMYGWTIRLATLQKIHRVLNKNLEYLDVEEIEAVALAMVELGYVKLKKEKEDAVH